MIKYYKLLSFYESKLVFMKTCTHERFQDQDYYRLGPDLHAATYTLKLGGRIRLQGSSRWVGDKENSQQNLLPKARVANFKLEGVDLSRTVIQENGISNIGKQDNMSALVVSYLIKSYSYHSYSLIT